MQKKLPSNWESMGAQQRRNYFFQEGDDIRAEAVLSRGKICINEILDECTLLGIKGTPGPAEKARIRTIMKGVKGWEKAKNKISTASYGRQWGWINSDIGSDIEMLKDEISVFD